MPEDPLERAHDVFDPIAQRHLALPDVDMGRMFRTTGLRVRGKVYAFLSHDGQLVLKLPQARIDELDAEGTAAHMVMRGRRMREWAVVAASEQASWEPLTDEARAFLDALTG